MKELINKIKNRLELCADAVDEILKLREKGLRSCVLLPLGYRETENDWLVNLKKVRKSREDLVTEIN